MASPQYGGRLGYPAKTLNVYWGSWDIAVAQHPHQLKRHPAQIPIPTISSLLRSRSGRSHVTLPVPTRLLQTDIHSFLGNKPINVWLSFCCECSRLWLVQRIQWQLNERLIGPRKQKRKTPRKECMSVSSSRVGTGSVTWLRPERLRRRLNYLGIGGSLQDLAWGQMDCPKALHPRRQWRTPQEAAW